MNWTRPTRLGPQAVPRIDPEGELYAAPHWLAYVWTVLVVLTVLEAANELFGFGGPPSVYENWIHDGVLVTATVLVLARAGFEPVTRRAWLAFGLAMAAWSAGTVAWTLVYGARTRPPYPSFADALWLLWYPLMVVGVVYLIRIRIPHFELHRWMDGLAVMLIVLAAGFALVVQPVAHNADQGTLATIIDFSYPVLDVLLMGVMLGVYGLLGWRPDGMWILIGLSVLTMTIADAAFAVQEARGVGTDASYSFVWTLGAVLMAYAAWVRVPGLRAGETRVTGFRVIALPLAAQALAAGIQVYAIFGEIGRSERVVTLIVLGVASVQIIMTRPRAEPAGGDALPATSSAPPEDLDRPG